MKMRKLMAVVLAVVVAISAMAISAFASAVAISAFTTDYESYDIPLANAGTTTTSSTTYALEIPFYGVNGYLYYGDTIELVLPVSVVVSSNVSSTYAGVELTPDYTLTTAEGITVDLQDPDEGTVVYCDADGTENTEGAFFKQTVEVGYSYRDYMCASWVPFEQCAMIHQTTTWASSCTLTVNMTVDTSSVGSIEDPADAKTTWQYYGWWTTEGQSSLLTYYTAGSEEATTVVYGYQVYSVSYTVGSDTEDNSIVILATVEDSTTSALLYWDHTLTQRGMIQNALATEGAYAEVEVKLNGTITGFAIYTLNTVSSNDATADWAGTTYWWNTSAYTALTTSSVSSYTLPGTTTDTLTFDVPLSQLYNSTYGLYNGGFTITQLITAEDNASVAYNYYTETIDDVQKLTATEVNLVLYIPVDETSVDATEPVEDTDTATEDDGEDDDTDLDVGDDVDDTADSNPTTGIVLALVPMAVAAAAAVASKRR
ncbi:MAG: hypothetical protein LUH23_02410 [Oscillospiraceae bacterium]|nr:hypothetical protein [Oscillospiraceae bacterium]